MGLDDIWLLVQIGLVELVLLGCICLLDYLYFFLNGVWLDDSIEVVSDIGICFYVMCGVMLIGESKGGLLFDVLVQFEVVIFKDSECLIVVFYDLMFGVMLQVVLVFCLFFLVSCELMCDVVILVCEKGVCLYMYLVENDEDIVYFLVNFGMLFGDYVESFGWIGDDVWYVYCVKFFDSEIDFFVCIGIGVVYCFCLNVWFVLGIVLVRVMCDVGVLVGFGVDGLVSNDCLYLGFEVWQVMFMVWLKNGFVVMGVCEVLEIVIFGGVCFLGCSDLGVFEFGKCVDFVLWDVIEFVVVGEWDFVVVFVFCVLMWFRFVYVEGCVVVCDYQFLIVDLCCLNEQVCRVIV